MQLHTLTPDFSHILFDEPSSVFHVLTESERKLFLDRMEVRKYRKGDFICRTGDLPAGLFCLISGTAKICRIGAGGREHIFRTTQPNALFGYISLFTNHVYSVSVKAIEDIAAAVIDHETLFSLLRTNSELSILFIKLLTTELSLSYFRTVMLTQKQMPARLAETLLFLRDTYGFEKDGVTLTVRFSRENIANLSNMTTANAIRTLSSFAGEKLIGLEGKRIKLLDIDGIKKKSGS